MNKTSHTSHTRTPISPLACRALAGLFLLACIATPFMRAADSGACTPPNQLTDSEKSQGWRLLWDGKTTDGWRGAGKKTFPDKGWSIENGEFIVQASEGREAANGGDIVTTEEFSAFELLVDFKYTEGANSGIKYFVTEKYESKGSAIGLEYQILDDEKHPDAKLGAAGNRKLGTLYDLIPTYPIPNAPGVAPHVGEWQHARIVSRADGSVEHWLNGVLLVEYKRGSPVFATLVARSKFAKYPDFGLAEKGHILLQDHGNEVHFKNIKIRVLK